MNRVIHFEVQAEKPEKLSEFYKKIFGWIISKKAVGNEDYWLIATGTASERGINGGLKRRTQKQAGMVPTIEVADLDRAVEEIRAQGGTLLEKKKSLPGTGFLAYCSDPEGNAFAILQYDDSVKSEF